MNFKYKNFYTFPLYLSSNILRLLDKSFLENCLLISTAIKNILSSLFDDSFTFVTEIHHHETSFSTNGLSKISIINTTSYCKYSVKKQTKAYKR